MYTGFCVTSQLEISGFLVYTSAMERPPTQPPGHGEDEAPAPGELELVRSFLSLHDHPPGDATIVLRVDESESRWQVRLLEGISKQSSRVALALSQ